MTRLDVALSDIAVAHVATRLGLLLWALAPSLDSFRRVFGRHEFGRYFANGLVVACTVVIASAPIAFLAATTVTRFRFRFRTTLLIMFLVAR